MNQWLQIRRLRGPAFLVLIGVLFLLSEFHIVRFIHSWPLLLVLAGLLSLAERAALSRTDAMEGGYGPGFPGYAGQASYAAPPYGGPGYGAQAAAPVVQAPSTDLTVQEPGSGGIIHEPGAGTGSDEGRP